MRVTLQCSTRTDGPTQVHESVQMHQAVRLMYAITDTEGNLKILFSKLVSWSDKQTDPAKLTSLLSVNPFK